MVNGLHPEEIKAKLRIAFGSLARFERQHRLPANSVAAALRRPHRRAEKTIIKVLGISGRQLWPSRYDKSGQRLSKQPPENYGRGRG